MTRKMNADFLINSSSENHMDIKDILIGHSWKEKDRKEHIGKLN